jgi:hypothetical protein
MEAATSHVAVFGDRELVVDRHFCDAHGKECVDSSLNYMPVGRSPLHEVAGAVCCDIRLLLSRPDCAGERQYVHLREKGGRRWLGFYCGFIEGSVILSSAQTPSPLRPFMHDVMLNIVRALGGTVKHVLIDDHVVDAQHYSAKLVIAAVAGSVAVDARPSDAIALAIRAGTEIFISERLLAVP